MSDPADKLSAQGPIVASRAERQVQCICDALRAGQRAIVVICGDPFPTRIPGAALAACASSTSRLLRIGRPLPKLLELQEIIGAAAGVAGGRGVAPQALGRLLQTAEPRQSMVLVIDDADLLPRQSLYYLAQMLNVLAIDAPALQIVFAGRPALLERLSHPDFETFRNRITLVGGATEPSLERVQQEGEPVFNPDTQRNNDLEQDNDSNNGDLVLGHENTPSIAPRSVQLPPLATAPWQLGLESGRIAPRPPVAYKAAVVLAMSCLVTISYVAFLVFFNAPTQSSAPAVRSGVKQEFAAAPGRSPSAPLDPRQTDKVIASLIDQATAAAAAGRFEEARRLDQAAHQAARAGVNPNGAPSPQVETALAQALPPRKSATAADRPETVGKTDQPILFPKLAPQLPAGPSPLVEAPRATPPEPTAPGRVAALQRPIELPPASGSPAAPSAPPEKPSPGLVQAEAGIACPPRDTFENAQRWVHERLKCERHPTPNGLWIEWAEYCPSGPLGYFVLKVKTGQQKVYLFENIPPAVWEGFKAAPSADKFYHSEIKGKRHWFRLTSKLKPSAPALTCHR
jgi:KTSC domain